LLEPDFVIPLLSHFGRGDELIAIFGTNGRITAMGILAYRGRGVWDSFQPAQAPLGLWMCRKEVPLSSLLPGLCQRLPGLAIAIGAAHQDPDIYSRPEDSPSLLTLDYIRTCRIPFKGAFNDYWETCSKNLRRNVRRQFNKLNRLGVTSRFEELNNAADIGRAIEEYGRLESSGWKSEHGTAVHPDNVQGKFYRTVLERFCAKDRGAVYQYRFDGAVVAMDLCIKGRGMLVNLKSAYDESVSSFSPAVLLLHEYLKKLFDCASIDCIEFYGPDMPWYRQWNAESRMMFHANYYRWPWLRTIVNHPAMSAIRRMAMHARNERQS
jgi:hypothetical protein